MTVLKRDTDYHTYSDYLTWSRDYGDELIDGDAYEDQPCDVYVAPLDLRFAKSAEEDDLVDTVVQPDVLIVSDLKESMPAACAVPPTGRTDHPI
jgi:hypothetical protein